MPDWLDPKAPLLTRFLQQYGYATAHYGKWHLANDMIPDSPFPSAYGYDDYGSYNCAGPQMFVHNDLKSAILFKKKSHVAGNQFLSIFGCMTRILDFMWIQNCKIYFQTFLMQIIFMPLPYIIRICVLVSCSMP